MRWTQRRVNELARYCFAWPRGLGQLASLGALESFVRVPGAAALSPLQDGHEVPMRVGSRCLSGGSTRRASSSSPSSSRKGPPTKTPAADDAPLEHA